MIIRFDNSYNPIEEAMQASRAKARTEDGRTAPVSGAELGLDAGEKADSSKKEAMAVFGDRVDISKEARELLQAQASENPAEDERQANSEQDELAEFAEAANNLKGLSEKFQSPATAGMAGAGPSGGGEDEGGGGAVDKLRKMIKEAQQKLEEVQLKMQEATAKASAEEDPAAQQLAQAEVQAAQQEMAAINAEIQMLQQQLQEAMKAESGGGGGSGQGGVGKIGINPTSNWAPSGRRIQVGAEGISSLT